MKFTLFTSLIILLAYSTTVSIANKHCYYDSFPNSPEVYFINHKRNDGHRRLTTELLSTMKLQSFSVDEIRHKRVYIPSDIMRIVKNSTAYDICKYQTNETIDHSVKSMKATSKTHLLQGLCTNKIKWTELYCSMSHLLAIYRAVHSTTATSKYALIMEDNVYIPISTWFNALADSAPSDFGILQLMTNYGVKALWDSYTPKNMWSTRENISYSSTGLYLINREKMRSIIDSIVHIDPVYPTIIQYTLIASKSKYMNNLPRDGTTKSLVCVAESTLAADRYIYALAQTYVSKIQLGYIQSRASTGTSRDSSQRGSESHTTNSIATDQLAMIGHVNFTKPKYPFSVACTDLKPIDKIQSNKPRILYILTCDTRSDGIPHQWIFTMPTLLHDDSVRVVNMCMVTEEWRYFLWKYNRLLKTLQDITTMHTGDLTRVHVIFTDADTFWSDPTIDMVWAKYDRARGSRQLVVSSEMNCWVGFTCNEAMMTKFYNNLATTPSHSPFLNSGFIMGSASSVLTMATYLVKHSDTWQPFDDQHAVSDYALRLRPEEVVLDYHQSLCGSFLVITDPQLAATHTLNETFYVCKGLDGKVKEGCVEWYYDNNNDGYYHIDQETCTLQKRIKENMSVYSTLHTLAPDPLIWHGNGPTGKEISYKYIQLILECRQAQAKQV